MTSDNPVAEQLVADARKNADKPANGPIGIAALVLGLVALAGSGLVPVLGWVLGAVAIVVAVLGLRRPDSANNAKIGLGAAVLALAAATFFFLRATGKI
ncbi:hypothetical protein GCM10023321_35420 [Pseudonocardia eucalypti]|uniref:DUF4190 domain-containing protein n=1 Tax=Pseudonocardia eucalypti TaxID=648755 RepID=A0ABP9Q682_9PSEU|nr:hypothetical protein [Pseudonocardia eucalypti]